MPLFLLNWWDAVLRWSDSWAEKDGVVGITLQSELPKQIYNWKHCGGATLSEVGESFFCFATWITVLLYRIILDIYGNFLIEKTNAPKLNKIQFSKLHHLKWAFQRRKNSNINSVVAKIHRSQSSRLFIRFKFFASIKLNIEGAKDGLIENRGRGQHQIFCGALILQHWKIQLFIC